jgi:hypothetical protein
MTEPADDMFASADSAAAIEAYVFSEFGSDGLKELLSLVEIDRESLKRDSLELEQVGLAKPAEIVRQHAQHSPPAIEQWNPYPEHDHANYVSWREEYLRSQRLYRPRN